MGSTGQAPPPTGLVLLGVLPADADIAFQGCPPYDGARVDLIRAANLYVVAAPVRIDDFAGHGEVPALDPERLTALVRDHDLVLRAMADTGRALVPLPFGTVARDVDHLRRLIESHCTEIYDALARLEGCDEWGVHVSVPREAAQRAVRSLARQVHQRLAACAEDAVIEPIESGALEERPSALSAAFLVNRDRLRELEQTIEDLQGFWDMAGGAIRLSGPWPCYHFARVDLGAAVPRGASVLLGPLSAPERSWAT